MTPQQFRVQEHDRIINKFNQIIPNYTAQLICMYAAPEAETWFIEDWNNGFGSKNYKLDHRIKTGLKDETNKLRKDQCKQGFECYFGTKLSDWICDIIQSLSEKHKIFDHEVTSYSKQKHGSAFLRQINPTKLEAECRIYFAYAYRAIRAIGRWE